MSKIAIGGDHAGFDYKAELVKMLTPNNEVKDFGPHTNESCDYPDFSHLVADNVSNRNFDFGILICGSANGVAMAANKHKGIRAAIAWKTELAVLARTHNDANILCLPSRFISLEEAKACVTAFLSTAFGRGRHQKRVDKIDA